MPFAHACAQHVFEQHVMRTPQAQALRYKAQVLSYDALNRRTNQLAHYLRRLGVKKEQLVGLSMERGFDLVIGMIAILKAGAAYLPLDPAYPQERLAYMLGDAGVTLLLSQQSLQAQSPAHQMQQVCVDAEWATIGQQPESNLPPLSAATDLVYVIYTSGSTGKPKGRAARPSRAVKSGAGLECGRCD